MLGRGAEVDHEAVRVGYVLACEGMAQSEKSGQGDACLACAATSPTRCIRLPRRCSPGGNSVRCRRRDADHGAGSERDWVGVDRVLVALAFASYARRLFGGAAAFS